MLRSNPLNWSLTGGALPVLVFVLAGLAGLYLLTGRPTRARPRPAAALLLGSVALAVAAAWFVDRIWRPFPDRLPASVQAWAGAAIAAVALAALVAYRAPWRRRAAAAAAAVLVVAAGAVGVNGYYDQYPTVRAAVGLGGPTVVSLGQALGRPAAEGRLARVRIPGTRSGFRARPALVYVPAAYHDAAVAPLPVLVLVAGQPGSPWDLFAAGGMKGVLDAYARRHGGRAPVVVAPDALGASLANPLCLDSRLGRAATYLGVDVPDWIRGHLRVTPDQSRWAVGGYSFGGTCALQLAVGFPRVYATFVDVSGQHEPTLGTRERTVRAAFGGDARAFRLVNPLDVLSRTRFPQLYGVLVAGDRDRVYAPQQRAVRAACAAAGMPVDFVVLPGGHSWTVWRAGLATGLERITPRLRLARA
jgi:enterochelin esterase-like enzyme